jgi:hypothetical protein
MLRKPMLYPAELRGRIGFFCPPTASLALVAVGTANVRDGKV